MYVVIHFIQPFNTLIGSLGTILVFFLIGGLGVLLALVSRKESILIRALMLLIGGFLVVLGVIMSVFLFREYTTGAVMLIASLPE